jgi:hypothetical protein
MDNKVDENIAKKKHTKQPLKQVSMNGPEIILLLKEFWSVLNGKWKLSEIVGNCGIDGWPLAIHGNKKKD